MRTVRRTLIVLVVLALLFVAADRLGAWIAGQAVEDQVSRELANRNVEYTSLDAGVGGFPFLTQVMSGEYEAVTLDLDGVRADEIRMSDVQLTASEVSAPLSTLVDRSGPITAGRLTGTGIVDYTTVADLTGLDGLELSPADGAEVSMRLPVETLGVSVVVVGTGTVSVSDHALELQVSELEAEDSSDIPPGIDVNQFAHLLAVDVPLPQLPYDLTVDGVRAGSTGFVVDMSASDVPLVQ